MPGAKKVEVVEASGSFLDPNLVETEVEVMGMGKSQCGCSCGVHNCCGTALLHVGSYVCFSKKRFAWSNGEEEDILEVYFLKDGVRTCKVSYLGKHVAFCADRYDGLCASILEIYTANREFCNNLVKCQK